MKLHTLRTKPEPFAGQFLNWRGAEGFSSTMQNIKLEKHGKYLRAVNMHGHPIADNRGRTPYHRLVLFEKLDCALSAQCHWCEFPLQWKTNLSPAFQHVINADHLDGDTTNNHPGNLVPSCWWCNANRSWAESYPIFWEQWRKWMKYVPPAIRPNLPEIAKDCGIDIDFLQEANNGC